MVGILSTELINSISKGGRSVALEVATKTTSWTRSHFATSQKEKFCAAVEEANIPSNTGTVVLVENLHQSRSDGQTHFTAMLYDEEGKAMWMAHIPAAKGLKDNKVDAGTKTDIGSSEGTNEIQKSE
ncbi:hypothetical protein E2P81_ATG06301 [Venturia nashicola]|uniref:Uncharacterized protein n=1 Tax=Venturia nashicola TaxID=86259 RepID=A0A4Z1P329_9PEZI|nr:hypothetical protein E6O75_ATG06451 [Venturia nashicola]TLD27955.1 hypothetical protein E2P81_ATG06301 [Venturia nashicola]